MSELILAEHADEGGLAAEAGDGDGDGDGNGDVGGGIAGGREEAGGGLCKGQPLLNARRSCLTTFTIHLTAFFSSFSHTLIFLQPHYLNASKNQVQLHHQVHHAPYFMRCIVDRTYIFVHLTLIKTFIF